jgi:hypothetical protein
VFEDRIISISSPSDLNEITFAQQDKQVKERLIKLINFIEEKKAASEKVFNNPLKDFYPKPSKANRATDETYFSADAASTFEGKLKSLLDKIDKKQTVTETDYQFLYIDLYPDQILTLEKQFLNREKDRSALFQILLRLKIVTPAMASYLKIIEGADSLSCIPSHEVDRTNFALRAIVLNILGIYITNKQNAVDAQFFKRGSSHLTSARKLFRLLQDFPVSAFPELIEKELQLQGTGFCTKSPSGKYVKALADALLLIQDYNRPVNPIPALPRAPF